MLSGVPLEVVVVVVAGGVVPNAVQVRYGLWFVAPPEPAPASISASRSPRSSAAWMRVTSAPNRVWGASVPLVMTGSSGWPSVPRVPTQFRTCEQLPRL